jgi:hypothetical protein
MYTQNNSMIDRTEKGTFLPKWQNQPTELLRVPGVFTDTLMGLAKLLDAGVISTKQIETWSEKQMANYKALKQVIVQPDPEKSKVTEIKSASPKSKVRRPP